MTSGGMPLMAVPCEQHETEAGNVSEVHATVTESTETTGAAVDATDTGMPSDATDRKRKRSVVSPKGKVVSKNTTSVSDSEVPLEQPGPKKRRPSLKDKKSITPNVADAPVETSEPIVKEEEEEGTVSNPIVIHEDEEEQKHMREESDTIPLTLPIAE